MCGAHPPIRASESFFWAMNRIRLEASTAALPVRERAEMEIIPRTSDRSFCGRVVRLGGIRPCGVTRAPHP